MIDPAVQRRRLFVMLGVDAVCVMVAVAAIIGHVRTHESWMLAAFVAALLVGFGAQVWMIMGFAKAGKAP